MSAEQKFNASINLLSNELRNARLHMLTAFPTGVEGQVLYHSVNKAPYFHDGTDFVPMDARKATNIPLSALVTDPLARANHTGTQTAATISDFHSQVRSSRLDQMAAPTASVSFNNQKITNLATPTDAGDAASKSYVDQASTTGNAATATKLATARNFSLSGVVTAVAVAFDGSANLVLTTEIADAALSIAKVSGLQGALNSKQDAIGYTPANRAGDTFTGPVILAADPVSNMQAATKQYVDSRIQQAASAIDPKNAVKFMRHGSSAAQSGLNPIDGQTVSAGDRILDINRSTGSEDGIFIAASGAWTRAADAADGQLTSGALVLVLYGSTYGGTQWYLNTPDPIVVGTTDQSWVQFGAGATYAPGNGLDLQGSTFSVMPGTGILVDGSGVHIDPAVVARHYSEEIGDGTTLEFTIAHNFNTRNVIPVLRNNTTHEIEYTGYEAPTVNTIKVTFTAAPTANAYTVSVFG